MSPGMEDLSDRQRTLLGHWLPPLEVVADHSWGLIETIVLEVICDADRLIVKAGGESDHHLEREIRAHRRWLQPWTSRGRAPELLYADLGAGIIVTRYLPGQLVLGSGAEREPEVYRQAGELLAQLHRQDGALDADYERRENAKSLALLDGPHRIAPETQRRLRELVASWPAEPVALVPTHGDWHPRNWLIDAGVVRAIDFGRAALRPPETDLARLASKQFRGGPDLEAAFLDGYGADPREPQAWQRTRVREAIGTAAWAYLVGDTAFEAQGHRMIADALGPHDPSH